MEKTYLICHVLSSLNGKINGSFMYTDANRKLSKEYARIREEYDGDAWIYGTTTTKEFTSYQKPELKENSSYNRSTDFIAKKDADLYYVSIDTAGEIGWDRNTFERAGRKAHIIEVVTEKTPKAYLEYLEEHLISYIFAGKEELDAKVLATKLNSLFGIKKGIICGGGKINWSLLQGGVVEELSMILSPVADTDVNMPSVFEKCFENTNGTPIEFELKKMEVLDGSGVHLTYAVKGN